MRGIDATAGFPLRDGQVPLFAMTAHGSARCVGIHVARRAARFEALEPVRQVVREQFGGFCEGISLCVMLRHDHGSRFVSDDFQRGIRFPGMASSPTFVREPEGNRWIEHSFRTLKEQLLSVRHFDTLEELAEALEEVRQRYNEHWLVERLHCQSPRQPHRSPLALEPAAWRSVKKRSKKSRAAPDSQPYGTLHALMGTPGGSGAPGKQRPSPNGDRSAEARSGFAAIHHGFRAA